MALVLTLAFSNEILGQFAERVPLNKPTKVLTGALPQADDWGIFVFSQVDDEGNTDYGIVNIKSYITNKLVLRAGVFMDRQSEVITGEGNIELGSPLKSFDYRYRQNEFELSGGLEYHFHPRNIFDTYFGLSGVLGLDGSRRVFSETQFNEDFVTSTITSNNFIYGFDAFLGFQFGVADLPIFIGLEYGVVGRGRAFQTLGYEVESSIGGVSTVEEYEVIDGEYYNNLNLANIAGQPFESLTARSSQFNQVFRLTLSYYFKTNN